MPVWALSYLTFQLIYLPGADLLNSPTKRCPEDSRAPVASASDLYEQMERGHVTHGHQGDLDVTYDWNFTGPQPTDSFYKPPSHPQSFDISRSSYHSLISIFKLK